MCNSDICFACSQIGDRNGELTARMNVEELMEALGVKEGDLSPSESEFKVQGKHITYSTIWSLCNGNLLVFDVEFKRIL